LMELKADFYPYGPRLVATDLGTKLQKKFPRTLGTYDERIKAIASFIRASNVARLERLATALMLISNNPEAEDIELAREMCSIKPHVSEDAAVDAVVEVREFLRDHEAEFTPLGA